MVMMPGAGFSDRRRGRRSPRQGHQTSKRRPRLRSGESAFLVLKWLSANGQIFPARTNHSLSVLVATAKRNPSLSITVKVSILFSISRRILMVSLRRICFSAGFHQVYKRQVLISSIKGKVNWLRAESLRQYRLLARALYHRSRLLQSHKRLTIDRDRGRLLEARETNFQSSPRPRIAP
jgi:hypothetical protein